MQLSTLPCPVQALHLRIRTATYIILNLPTVIIPRSPFLLMDGVLAAGVVGASGAGVSVRAGRGGRGCGVGTSSQPRRLAAAAAAGTEGARRRRPHSGEACDAGDAVAVAAADVSGVPAAAAAHAQARLSGGPGACAGAVCRDAWKPPPAGAAAALGALAAAACFSGAFSLTNTS